MDELEEHERKVAFEKKYVLRKDYDRDIKLARHDGMYTASVFILLVVPSIAGVFYFIYTIIT